MNKGEVRRKMPGTIYGVGVGPGDPELMTLKGVRRIKEAQVIAIPGKDRESCMAYRIAARAVEEIKEKEILPLAFPMTKDEAVLRECHDRAAEQIAAVLDTGRDAAFLTLGDPTVYSTYLYLHKRLLSMGYESEIVSGVPSFCAAAARLAVGLGEKADSIHILPGSYPVEEGLALSGTRVLMKSGKQLAKVKKALTERGLKAVMAENCGMEEERLFYKTEEIPETAGYYSLIIVKEDLKAAVDGCSQTGRWERQNGTGENDPAGDA